MTRRPDRAAAAVAQVSDAAFRSYLAAPSQTWGFYGALLALVLSPKISVVASGPPGGLPSLAEAGASIFGTLSWSVPVLVALAVAFYPIRLFLLSRMRLVENFRDELRNGGLVGITLAALATLMALGVVVHLVHCPKDLAEGLLAIALFIGVTFAGVRVGQLVAPSPDARHAALPVEIAQLRVRIGALGGEEATRAEAPMRWPRWRWVLPFFIASVGSAGAADLAGWIIDRFAPLGGATDFWLLLAAAAVSTLWQLFIVGPYVGEISRSGRWVRCLIISAGAIIVLLAAWTVVSAFIAAGASLWPLLPFAIACLVPAISGGFVFTRAVLGPRRYSLRTTSEDCVRRAHERALQTALDEQRTVEAYIHDRDRVLAPARAGLRDRLALLISGRRGSTAVIGRCSL